MRHVLVSCHFELTSNMFELTPIYVNWTILFSIVKGNVYVKWL